MKICGAKTRSGGRCQRRPLKGTNRCRLHGGASPQAQRKAEERIMRQKVGALLVAADIPFTDPLEGLLTEVARSSVAVEILGSMIAELDDPAAATVNATGPIYGANHLGDAVPHVLISMWNEERDRHAKFCKLALDAGVAERQVRLAEQQGALLAKVVTAVLDDPELGLPQRKRELGRKVVARHLRALSA